WPARTDHAAPGSDPPRPRAPARVDPAPEGALMRFAAPEYLVLLWVVLALAGLRLLAIRRRHRRARAFATPELYRALTPDLAGPRRGLRDALRLIAAASLV